MSVIKVGLVGSLQVNVDFGKGRKLANSCCR